MLFGVFDMMRFFIMAVFAAAAAPSVHAEVHTHLVRSWDTLWSIAKMCKIDFQTLLDYNNIRRDEPGWDVIRDGDVLIVKYENESPPIKVVDCIIEGRTEDAARYVEYPFCPNIFKPVLPPVKDEAEFVKWFPVLFDDELREKLRMIRDKTGGWTSRNWQGDCFGQGELYVFSGKLCALNAVSRSAFAVWNEAYGHDLETLAPAYRTNCVWAACYFKSDDGAYFGRVDAQGEPWMLDDDITEASGGISAGLKVSSKFRIMLFKSGQKPSDEPYRVFYYDAKDDTEYASRGYDWIVSEREEFYFWFSETTQIPTEIVFTFDSKTDMETNLGLNICTWPPNNAGK